jgi:hypothetical protein
LSFGRLIPDGSAKVDREEVEILDRVKGPALAAARAAAAAAVAAGVAGAVVTHYCSQ